MFKFIHAADIHLDSPLRGLERYDGAPVDEIRQATRRAFENLIRLAIEEQVAFVLLAGDLYDGDWKDYNTGLYFTSQMVALRDAGIPVFLIAGNHDAANKMTRSLPVLENVKILSPRRPETVRLDDYNVAIHGQGFATAAVTDDLSQAYPAAAPGCFNIGMLHTCATGRDGHERYAPCTLDGLRGKNYDYWALGHVHNFETLAEAPWVVFPGNVQGRHIRESGVKGCMLVTVNDNHEATPARRALDVLRWETCEVDASRLETGDDVIEQIRVALRERVQAHAGMPLAVRLEVCGASPAHETLSAAGHHWLNEIRAAALDISSNTIWIEKIKLRTSPPSSPQADYADTPFGELLEYLDELRENDEQLAGLGAELADLKKKLPPDLLEGGDLFGPAALRSSLDGVRQTLAARLLSRAENSA